MAARTGAQFLKGLRDRRELWVGKDRVTDPLDHPALRGGAQAIAETFDLHHTLLRRLPDRPIRRRASKSRSAT